MTEDLGLFPITPQEERELRRVYDYLCEYSARTALELELESLQKSLNSNSNNYEQALVSSNRDINEVMELSPRVEAIKRSIYELDSNPNKKISAIDVTELLKELGQKTNRKEVEEMIWECDEDLDGCLNWAEFKLMFSRNIMDRTGLEPSRMVVLLHLYI